LRVLSPASLCLRSLSLYQRTTSRRRRSGMAVGLRRLRRGRRSLGVLCAPGARANARIRASSREESFRSSLALALYLHYFFSPLPHAPHPTMPPRFPVHQLTSEPAVTTAVREAKSLCVLRERDRARGASARHATDAGAGAGYLIERVPGQAQAPAARGPRLREDGLSRSPAPGRQGGKAPAAPVRALFAPSLSGSGRHRAAAARPLSLPVTHPPLPPSQVALPRRPGRQRGHLLQGGDVRDG